ncbi:MAG TPA: DUF4175 family protein [Planctomycetota bacterium]|nr:DUF4175 family protein [Planctomycetota bacterium]
MSAPLLLDRLAAVRARSRGVDLTRDICRVMVVALGLMAAFFLLDFWVLSDFENPVVDRIARAILLIAELVAFVVFVRRGLWRTWKRHESDDAVAMRVERGHAPMRGRLVATVQLSRVEREGTSQDLVDALVEETVEASEGLRFTDVIDATLLKKAALTAGLLLLLASALAAWKPGHALALLARMVLTGHEYPTSTRIAALTPGGRVPRGEPFAVQIDVLADSDVPEEAALEVMPADGGDTLVLPLRKLEVQDDPSVVRFAATVPKVLAAARYRALAGDARWHRWEELAVIERPAVRGLELAYRYPGYLRKPDETSTVGDVRCLAGTNVTVTAVFSKAVVEAGLELRLREDRKALPITLADDGMSGTCQMPIESSGSYRLRLRCTDGLEDADPVDYAIVALKDRAPSVRVVTPAQDKTVTDIARPRLAFTVRDDHGVAAAELKFRIERDDEVGGDDDEARGAALSVGNGGREVSGESLIDLRALGVQAGSRMAWWIEARDACEPPNVAVSPTYRFTVVDVGTMSQQLERSRRELLQELERVRTEQKKGFTEVQGLHQQLRSGSTPPK